MDKPSATGVAVGEAVPATEAGGEAVDEPGAGAEPVAEGDMDKPSATGVAVGEAVPEPEAGGEAVDEPGAGAGPVAEVGEVEEAGAKPDVEPGAGEPVDPELEAAPEAEQEAEPVGQAGAEPKTDTELEGEPQPEKPDAEPEAEPDAQPDTEPGQIAAAASAEGDITEDEQHVPESQSEPALEPETEPALEVQADAQLEPAAEVELGTSGPKTTSSPSAQENATASMKDEAASLGLGLVVPQVSMVFTEESGEIGAAGAEVEQRSEAGGRPMTSQSEASRLDTPQRVAVVNEVLEPMLDRLWPLEPPVELTLYIIVRPISVRQKLVCPATMSWYGVKEMLSEALGVSPLDMTIVCHGEPRVDDITLLEDEIQTETRLEMLIATPDPAVVARESSAQLRRSLYSKTYSSGGRRTCQLRQQHWEHPPYPPVKPQPPLYPQLAVSPKSFQPTPPTAETIELINRVDNFNATRSVQRRAVDAAWDAVVAVADGQKTEAGVNAIDLRHVSAAVGDAGRNPYATLPWNEVALPSWGDSLPFGLQHDPYGWIATRKRLFSPSSTRGGMQKGNLASDIAKATTPEEDKIVEALRPTGWQKSWPLNEANRLLVAKLNERANSHAHRGGHIAREASCRNGAIAVGRCPIQVTSGEQAALELKLQFVGQWLGDEIDEVLSDCKVIEAHVTKSRQDALLEARRQTVRLPKVQTGFRAHHGGGDVSSSSKSSSSSSSNPIGNVYAKRGRLIKMPRMRPPAHSLYASASERVQRAGEESPSSTGTPLVGKLTSQNRAIVAQREHQSAYDGWRRTARARLESDTPQADSPRGSNSPRGSTGSMHLAMLDSAPERLSRGTNGTVQARSTPRTPRHFPQDKYRTSKALTEGRVVEDETYVKMRLSARRQNEQQRQGMIDRRFVEPDGTVQVWLKDKETEVPYKLKQVRQSRKDMRRLNSDRMERTTKLEKEAKGLLKEINFLLERAAHDLQNSKFSQQLLDEQRMKEKRIVEFEGRMKRGEISLHLMGALRNVHRTLLMELFKEMDADEGGTLDREEIRVLARSLGNQLSEPQLDQAMREMDEDGSGEVDFEEFFDWWCKALNQKDDGSGSTKGAIRINTKGAESEGYEVVPFGK